MDQAASSFRERVTAARGDRRRCRYPEELRAEALAYVDAARARGVGLIKAAQALGVDKSVLSGWRAKRQRSAMRVVKVVDAPLGGGGGGIVVHGPGGLRVEGLDVAALAALMRSLS
jgi:transposase